MTVVAATVPPVSSLAGKSVFLPRSRPSDALADALRAVGAEVTAVPLTRTVPGDAGLLDDAAHGLAAGRYTWLVLTSARTITALMPYLCGPRADGNSTPGTVTQVPGPLPRVPAGARVAAVGPATARAWEQLTGGPPDLVAAGSAAALLDSPKLRRGPASAAPSSGTRLLLPCSTLADPALAEGLRAAGWEVDQVDAYSTATVSPADLPPLLPGRWQHGGFDVALLTAGSTAQALLALLGPPPPATRVATIGAATARTARTLDLPVHAVAASPTPAGVLDAVTAALNHAPGLQACPDHTGNPTFGADSAFPGSPDCPSSSGDPAPSGGPAMTALPGNPGDPGVSDRRSSPGNPSNPAHTPRTTTRSTGKDLR